MTRGLGQGTDAGGGWWAGLGLLAVLAVLALDLLNHSVVLVGLTVVGPLLCAITAPPRATRAVGAAAVVIAAVSFVWDHAFPTWRYWVPLAVVSSGAIFAVLTAELRRQLLADTERLRILAELAGIAAAGRGAQELAVGVADLLVPDLVDLCVIDQLDGGGLARRLAGAFSGDTRLLEEFMARDPLPAGACLDGPRENPQTRHLPRIDAEVRRRIAHDEHHHGLLERMGLRSAVTIPLRARERYIGSMILATRAPRARLDAAGVAYFETFAGRVALAIDNALLTGELSRTTRQRDAILASVGAGIIVRAQDGSMVYANQAAADLMKVPDPAALMDMGSGDLIDRFDLFTEEGERLAPETLPGNRVLAGEPHPPDMTLRNIVRATGEERWLLNKASAVLEPSGEIQMAVNVVEDVTATKRNEVAQRLLATTARELARISDSELALQVVADAAVPFLADWAGIDIIEPGGTVRTVAIAHRDPEKVKLGWELRERWPVTPEDPGGAAEVLRTGRPHLIAEITDETLSLAARSPEHLEILRAVGLNSSITAPISAGPRRIGAISFASSTSRRFDERDLELAVNLGNQIGLFLSNARLNAEQAHIAHTLQASLIPGSLPVPRGWALSSAYRAAGLANEVGGDFYDVVLLERGWAAVIGDVVGKGAAAAALTAIARHTLTAILKAGGDGREALAVLNRRLREQPEEVTLVTALVVVIGEDGTATIHSAGHPLPLLRRAGRVSSVGEPDPVLGFLDELPGTGTVLQTEPGDELLLYTDGVLDATGVNERFGEERLLDTLARLPDERSAARAEDLLAVIESFLTGDQGDDIAILSLSRTRESATAADRTMLAA